MGIALILIVGVQNMYAQNTRHQVKAGDTLFGIAEKYNVSVQQVKSWNNLSSSALSVGQQLVIKKQADTDTDPSGITHTVEPKETLFSISKKYGVTIDEIKSWE